MPTPHSSPGFPRIAEYAAAFQPISRLMSLFGPATPASVQPVSGVRPSDRPARTPAKATPPGSTRASDEVDVSGALASDAVRNLKSNGQEETTDDRQQQDNYRPQQKPEPRKPLDLQG